MINCCVPCLFADHPWAAVSSLSAGTHSAGGAAQRSSTSSQLRALFGFGQKQPARDGLSVRATGKRTGTVESRVAKEQIPLVDINNKTHASRGKPTDAQADNNKKRPKTPQKSENAALKNHERLTLNLAAIGPEDPKQSRTGSVFTSFFSVESPGSVSYSPSPTSPPANSVLNHSTEVYALQTPVSDKNLILPDAPSRL